MPPLNNRRKADDAYHPESSGGGNANRPSIRILISAGGDVYPRTPRDLPSGPWPRAVAVRRADSRRKGGDVLQPKKLVCHVTNLVTGRHHARLFAPFLHARESEASW